MEPAKASSGTANTSNGRRTNNTSADQSFSRSATEDGSHKNYSFIDKNRTDSFNASASNKVYRDSLYEDKMMQILNSKTGSGKEWVVLAPGLEEDEECKDCHQCSRDRPTKGGCLSAQDQVNQR